MRGQYVSCVTQAYFVAGLSGHKTPTLEKLLDTKPAAKGGGNRRALEMFRRMAAKQPQGQSDA